MLIHPSGSDAQFLSFVYRIVNLKDAQSVASNGKTEAVAKKAYDGLHIYGEAAGFDRSKIAAGFDSNLNYAMKEFSYDQNAEVSLVNLVSWLKEKGLDVALVLAPYHPDLFLRMQRERTIYLELEQKFRDIALHLDIQIIGSYNTVNVGCTRDEFYDGMHPKRSCMRKVVSEYSTY